MLSKSQARLFFLTGTSVFSLLFLFLTVDSIGKVPAQTKSQNITDSVKRGKYIFEKNNCMGCHTILGEGAYYAPDLTKSYITRGSEWIKVFIKDPQAMYPNQRKMVKYNFSDEEISDVISFLKWISEMDLNGFPKDPPLKKSVSNVLPETNSKTARAMPQKFQQLCISCHMLEGKGGTVGPALDNVGKKFDSVYLNNWLKNPQSIKPGTTMPALGLSDVERKEIVDFLSSN